MLTNSLRPPLSPPIHHVFVDFENVQRIDLALIGAARCHLTLLLGATQKKLATDLVEKLLDHAATVQLVRLTSSGRNALDFALAYYLGRAVMADPTGRFHLISKDTGYDPLVAHLRCCHIDAQRHVDFSTLPIIGTATASAPPPEDLLLRAVDYLRKNFANRPKRKKTLVSHLLAFAGPTATEADILQLIERLHQTGHISIADTNAVTYRDTPV